MKKNTPSSSGKVLMLLGSRRCVPPTEASNTLSWMLKSFVDYSRSMDVQVVSQWDESLHQDKYDHERYLHVSTANEIRLKRLLYLLPYRIRKWLFGIADPKVIAYYLGQALMVHKLKPDVVVAHVAYPLFRISRFLNSRYKHVYYFHSSNLADFPPHFIHDLYQHADGLVSICQIAIDGVVNKYGSLPMPSVVIHNGVDTTTFNPENVNKLRTFARQVHKISEDTIVLLYAGRLHPSKGIDKILDAFLIVQERYPNLVLLIAGDENFERNPDLEFSKQFRDDAQMRGNGSVRFIGWLPYNQLLQAYAVSDIGVLASLEIEGNSMFLLEAMACGLSVVSTAVGGVPEIVVHRETGLLINPSQEITKGLVLAISELLENPSQRKEYGMKAALRVSSRFSAENMVQKLEEFLNANFYMAKTDV